MILIKISFSSFIDNLLTFKGTNSLIKASIFTFVFMFTLIAMIILMKLLQVPVVR